MLTSGRADPLPRGDDDAIHILSRQEQRWLFAIEWKAVARAMVAGALSALASGVTEVIAGRRFGLDAVPTQHDLVRYWVVYLVVTIVVSIAEIAYLYVDTLMAVRALAHCAGVRFEGSQSSRTVAASLARAALELPDSHEPVLGVNPRRESSRARLVLASLAYKLKVSVSSFVFKLVVRRALGRFATRQLLAFAAVPINALWNGIVTYRVLREARIRAIGPSAVEAVMRSLEMPPHLTFSEEGKQAMVRAVASAMVRSESAHPNLVYLLRRMHEMLGPFDDEIVLDDPRLLLAQLAVLEREQAARVRRVLALASILDGRLAGNEKRLLRDAAIDIDLVATMRRTFMQGGELDPLIIRC